MARSIRILLAAACLAAAALPSLPSPAEAAGADDDTLLVKFDPGTPAAERRQADEAAGARPVRSLPGGVRVVRLRPGSSLPKALATYRRFDDVAYAEPNRRLRLQVRPDDPFFPGNGSPYPIDLWGLHNTGQDGGVPGADIHAPEAWDLAGLGGPGPWPAEDFTVGVVDTGVDATHPDLSGKIVLPCYHALDGTGQLSDGCADDHGHGTLVAGIIAAVGNNGLGVVGVAPNARVLMCKALGADGTGFTSDIAACIGDLVARRDALNLRVISLSLGGEASQALEDAVDHAAAAGILVVAAAGNDGDGRLVYPAAYDSVVSVGATDRTDAHAPFSNANDDVELSAPGVDIVSTVPGGYAVADGTSMATPHVAAVAALVAWKTGKTADALRSLLQSTADDLGPAGRDPAFGFGRVNACRALGGCTPPPPPTVLPPPPPLPAPAPQLAPPPPPPPAPGTLAGRVLRGRRPLRGAAVVVTFPDGRQGRLVSQAGGRYWGDLPPGTYLLQAQAGRKGCRAAGPRGPRVVSVRVASGRPTQLNWYC